MARFLEASSFVLDATDLAASGKKVAIRGDYQKIGEASYLCEIEIGKGELNRCGISVPLLFQDAPRPLRGYLMRTWNAVPLGVFSDKA
jgi:hypothetical protein